MLGFNEEMPLDWRPGQDDPARLDATRETEVCRRNDANLRRHEQDTRALDHFTAWALREVRRIGRAA